MAKQVVSPFGSGIEFAKFGKQSFAYVRPVKSDDVKNAFPEGADLPNGVDLWALFAADGQPLALADERAMVMENAEELELVTLALH